MGQQQLLLIVLGIVIVGLAVVVGIQAFAEKQKQANTDALILTGMEIAADLHAWVRKPQTMGGGRQLTGSLPSISSISVSLSELGYTVNSSGEYVTLDGTFTMTKSGSDIFIEGVSDSLSGGNQICIEVNGVTEDDISTAVLSGTGSCG